jgi:hypothetical protein
VRERLIEFNNVNEVSGGFCWQCKKFAETSCLTTKLDTNGSAQDSADYFDICCFLNPYFACAKTRKTPVDTHFLCLGNKKNAAILRLLHYLYILRTVLYFII